MNCFVFEEQYCHFLRVRPRKKRKEQLQTSGCAKTCESLDVLEVLLEVLDVLKALSDVLPEVLPEVFIKA